VSALLRNAGVDPDGVPPETLAIMGTILRTTVDGLIEMLRARAEFRNQFRLPVTRVRTSENNPLKFAINAEDALGSLLGRRNPGYMPPLEAFNDAFDDMRFHQIATLAGMRAGFAHVMNRFDPDRLQEQFDRHLKRAGFLPMATRFRYWELYVDLFEELAGDPDAAFHRMFGEEFASAYEKQLEALKRSRAKPQR
jgi:type VI secretion system FHA domain protein